MVTLKARAIGVGVSVGVGVDVDVGVSVGEKSEESEDNRKRRVSEREGDTTAIPREQERRHGKQEKPENETQQVGCCLLFIPCLYLEKQ